MKSLIFILLFSSFLSQAAEVEVDWVCPQENFPGVPQLDQKLKVKVNTDSGAIKLKPDPFKPKALSDGFFRNLNPLNKTKKNLAIDYTGCINAFVSKVQEKFPEYQNEWGNKLREDIKKKAFFKDLEGKKLLPTFWDFNKAYGLTNDEWRAKTKDICVNDSKEYLGTELLKHIRDFSGVTSAHPSKQCMDKIITLIDEKIGKDEASFCEYSNKICDNLKLLKESASKQLQDLKQKRDIAISADEAKFIKSVAQINESDFEEDFLKKISGGKDCSSFTDNISSSTDPEKIVQSVKLHNLISKNLNTMMDRMDGACQQKFLRVYMDNNGTRGLIDDYRVNAFCEINETDFCKGLKDRFKIVDDNIQRMFEKSFGEAGKNFYNNVACEITQGPQSLDDLLGQLKQFEKVMACRELGVGESKVVISSANVFSPTGLALNYSLEKTGEKSYKARLNLKFNPNPGAGVTGEEMLKRTQTCMKEMSPYLKGPNGENLAVEILGSDQTRELASNNRPPQIKIGITGGDHRSDSTNYKATIDCPTITHEVMHLLGLCDEYKETATQVSYDPETGKMVMANVAGAKSMLAYNCRPVSKVPSIMSHQNEVVNSVVPKAPVCRCESALCKKVTTGSKKIQDLYIRDPWAISNKRLSSEYCTYKVATPMPFDKYEKEGEPLSINEESDSSIGYTVRYIDSDATQVVQNLKITCTCPAGDAACLENLEDVKTAAKNMDIPQKNYCPGGSDNVFSKIGIVGDGINHSDDGTFTFNGGLIDPEASLLHPQHFERIIGGTCPERGEAYAKCAMFSYKSDPTNKCADVPKECQDPKYFQGVKTSKAVKQ